jgi:hypothetical protein
LFLFVFSSFNILDYGYATLENFFNLSPYILLLLIPAVTMRPSPMNGEQAQWKFCLHVR